MALTPERLTPRQHEVLRLLCLGYTDKEVARALSVKPSAIKQHLKSIKARLGAQTRVHAAVLWLQSAPPTSPAPPGAVALRDVTRPVPEEGPFSPQDAFWAQVERPVGPHACWIWTGPSVATGAGARPECYLSGLGELGRSARRIAYILSTGVQVPREVRVVPACPAGERRCINPAHVCLSVRGNAPQWRRWRLLV